MKDLKTTLLIIVKDNKILLALKKRGFGEGKYNGVGGKVEPTETIEASMLRETKEEIGIEPKNYKFMATNYFDEYVKGIKTHVIMYIYLAKDFVGTLKESEEVKPCWFHLDKIPYDKMFFSDRYWLPLLLNEQKFEGYFNLDENYNLLLHEIKKF